VSVEMTTLLMCWIILSLLLSVTCFTLLTSHRKSMTTTRHPSSSFNNVIMMSTKSKDILFDTPVSNHGARVRMIIRSKGIEEYVDIKQPSDVGGLKSPAYLKLNPQGKMPLLLCEPNHYPIPESDCIARYLLEKYRDFGPSFIPSQLMQQSLCNQICRFVDLYISPVQGSMYKAAGTPFSIYGTNRSEGLEELKRQLHVLEHLLTTFEQYHPPQLSSVNGRYLCGDEISLADVTLYPTIVFCVFILPQFFGWDISDFLGPKLYQWWSFMNTEVSSAMEVRKEMEIALNGWKDNGRFNPIMMELKASTEAKIQ